MTDTKEIKEQDIVEVLELVFGMKDKDVNESEIVKRTFSNKQLHDRFIKAAEILKPQIESYGYNSQIIGIDKATEILKKVK